MAKKNIKRLFALVLAVSMVMSLSVNAFAMDGKDAICGKETHAHDESCFEAVLACDTLELICTEAEHTHDEACMHQHDETCPVYDCEQEACVEEHEHEEICHLHDVDCYSYICEMEDHLICDTDEHEHDEACEHQHDADCAGIVCELTVCAEEHECTDECHQHGDDCYGIVCELDGQLDCTAAEHAHDEACEHQHDEDCIAYACGMTAETLVCEIEIHEHVDECYTSHAHEDACFEIELICETDEHAHEDACYVEEIDEEIVDEEIIDEEIVEDEIIDEEEFEDFLVEENRFFFSAADEIDAQDNNVSTDKTAEWADDEQTIADVTLSVPGDAELNVDVVLVLGGGMSANKATVNAAIELFKPLLEDNNVSTNIKLGLVALERSEEVILDINDDEALLDLDTYEELIEEKFEYIASLPGGTTNVHGPLKEVKKMLDKDDDVPAENKYVFLIATGRTYCFDDENGNDATIVNKTTISGKNYYYFGNYLWQSQRGQHSSLYMIPDRYKNNWDAYWADVCKWVEADGDKYVFTFPLDEDDPYSFETWYGNNNKDLRGLGLASSRFGLAIINPAPTAADFVTGEIAGIGSGINPQNALNYERAQYETYNAYKDLQDMGYNCFALCSESPNYQNNSEYIKQGAKYAGTSTMQLGHSFMNFLAGGEAITLFDYVRDEDGNLLSTSSVLKEDFFEPIAAEILYATGIGSKVEDFMGYDEDKFDFDFMVDGDITLKVGDVTYVTTKLDAATEGATASYEFTAPVEGATATFTLDYYYGNGTTTEKFVWTFGENVSNFAPASLTYQVELVDVEDDPTKEDVEVETNRSATLYDPDGEDLGDFPIPELTKEKYYVAYEYIGEYTNVGPNPPAKAYYFAGTRITVEGDAGYRVNDYVFSGWQDPCNDLVNGIMPAHDVTLQGYYLPMNDIVDPPIGIKTDKETEGYDYEVTIAVPGDGEKVKIHDEVILILDGSYSVDEEWEDMKETIIAIGEKVLGGAGRTQMTVISFGMGDNIVVEGIKTVDELKEMLPALPGGLLYGRSSTNCEAGFTGALKYIESKQAELSEVDVVFISDGGINTDETPRQFDDWARFCDYINDLTLAKSAIEFPFAYGNNQTETFYNTFGNEYDGMDANAILADIFSGKYDDQFFMDYCDKVWAEVYAYSGLTIGKEYPISVVERAFVKFDKEKDTYVQDLFYYATYKSKSVTYPNMANRTVAAAEDLAYCSLVDELYLIRYANHGNGWWVKNVEGGKNYIKAENVAGLLDVIGPMTEELAQTNYTNVVITDYMSKWVNLDTDSIRIVNDTTGETIWTVADGWLSDDIPTVKNPPVVVELVAEEDYAAGGADVVGNTNGDIYKLTWYVKDDCLLRTDNYSLRYTVTVDVAEEGFVPGVEYPANGNTYVDYENDGHNDIDVPNVAIPAYTVTYIDGQIVLQETTSLATGADIPECDEPASYTSGGYKFTFKNWELIEGTEGANDTVGTTNLVYKAVYTKSKLTSDITPTNPEGETIEILEDDIPLADIPALFGDDHFAYIIGRDDGLVHPEANITRAEVATIFFRLLADEVRTALMTGENDFSDVNEGQWYNHAVSTLSSMGIVLGRDDGTYYDPDAFITRAEFAAIAARFDSFGNPEGVFFSDIEGHWAEREIIIAANNGWVEGYNGLFRPDDYITRAEAMTLVNRVLHRLPETEDDLLDYMVIWPDNMDVDAWYYLDVQEATNSHFYERKADPVYESWTEFREPYDWSLLEY